MTFIRAWLRLLLQFYKSKIGVVQFVAVLVSVLSFVRSRQYSAGGSVFVFAGLVFPAVVAELWRSGYSRQQQIDQLRTFVENHFEEARAGTGGSLTRELENPGVTLDDLLSSFRAQSKQLRQHERRLGRLEVR